MDAASVWTEHLTAGVTITTVRPRLQRANILRSSLVLIQQYAASNPRLAMSLAGGAAQTIQTCRRTQPLSPSMEGRVTIVASKPPRTMYSAGGSGSLVCSAECTQAATVGLQPAKPPDVPSNPIRATSTVGKVAPCQALCQQMSKSYSAQEAQRQVVRMELNKLLSHRVYRRPFYHHRLILHRRPFHHHCLTLHRCPFHLHRLILHRCLIHHDRLILRRRLIHRPLGVQS